MGVVAVVRCCEWALSLSVTWHSHLGVPRQPFRGGCRRRPRSWVMGIRR